MAGAFSGFLPAPAPGCPSSRPRCVEATPHPARPTGLVPALCLRSGARPRTQPPSWGGGSRFQRHSLALGLTSQERGASPPSASVGLRARPVAGAAVLPGRVSIGVLPPGTPVAWGAVVPMSEPRRPRHREMKSAFRVAEGGEADLCRPTADGASWGSSSCLAWGVVLPVVRRLRLQVPSSSIAAE